MIPERVKLALGGTLLLVGVVSGIWFTERLREYPGPPLAVALGPFDNGTGDADLDGALELVLDEGRFVLDEPADYELTGGVAREGSGYRVEVRVVELSGGDVLVAAEAIVRSKEAIVRSFEELSAELRRKLAQEGR